MDWVSGNAPALADLAGQAIAETGKGQSRCSRRGARRCSGGCGGDLPGALQPVVHGLLEAVLLLFSYGVGKFTLALFHEPQVLWTVHPLGSRWRVRPGRVCRCPAHRDGGGGVGVATLGRRGRAVTIAALAICTFATVELMAGYWDGSIPFADSTSHRYWQHVTGSDSLLNLHIGRNALF